MTDELRLPGSEPRPTYTTADDASLPSRQPVADGASLPARDAPPAPPPAQPLADAPGEAPADARAESRAESRAERIRRVTAAGGLTELPETWGEDDGDWRTVQSDDPFEVLYLDYRQANLITTPVVTRHRDLVYGFWQQRLRNMAGNASARASIELRYGPQRVIEGFQKRIGEAYERLVANAGAGIAAEAERRHAVRRGLGEQALEPRMVGYTFDGAVDPEESQALLADGERLGLLPDEAATFLVRKLREQGFTPIGTPTGRTVAEQLASVRWLTPARQDKEAREAEARRRREAELAASAVATLKLGDGDVVRNVAELIDFCDRSPEKAQKSLYQGYFEEWLGKTLHDAGLAHAAHEVAARWGRRGAVERAKGLELFVRDLSRATERPYRPVIRAEPATWTPDPLPVGATAAISVRLARAERRLAWGTILRDTRLAGLTVPESFEPGDGSIELELDTLQVPPGRYAGVVTLHPEGGPPAMINIEYTVLPLALRVDHPKLDFGAIPFGKTVTRRVLVTTTPAGGRLVGSVGVEKAVDGLSVQGAVEGSGAHVDVTVNTTPLRAGVPYGTTVRVVTNAGAVDVPVSFRVGLSTGTVLLWSVGMAVLFGAGMGFLRAVLADSGYRGWYERFPWASAEASLVTALITVAVTLLALRTVIARRRRRRAAAAKV